MTRTTEPETATGRPSNPTAAIDVVELAARLDDPELRIVDVRPLAAYNGWRLRNEPRGGHVPGAVAFPNAWLDTVDAP